MSGNSKQRRQMRNRAMVMINRFTTVVTDEIAKMIRPECKKEYDEIIEGLTQVKQIEKKTRASNARGEQPRLERF